MHSTSTRIPGPGEKAVSASVVVVVAGVLVGMFLQQARFSPAVQVAGALAAAAPASVGRQDLLSPWPAGSAPMGASEAFSAATLSDKIDGKAELYLSAGFVRLDCQRIRMGADPDSWIEMFVFDMGTPSNAFSVWSSQKRPDASDAGLADYSYRAENELCLVHGKFYVEMVGADARPSTLQGAEGLARAFVDRTAVTEHANMGSEQALFPKENQIPGSVALVSSDVFGSDRLKSVFLGRYKEGADEVTLFMARRNAPANALREAADLRTFLVQDCGGKEVAPKGFQSPGIADAGRTHAPSAGALTIVDMGGGFDAVFVSGPYLAGVHQAASQAVAERWADILRRRIEGGPR
jgi:hypothetical protein